MPPHRLIALLALTLASAAAAELKVAETVLGPAPPTHVYVSPDAKRWAYVREENNRFRVVLDGKEGKPYDWINHKEVAFTADGSKALYIARDGRRSLLVANAEESPRDHFVDHFVSSATGARVAYAIRRGSRMAAVVDGKETAEYGDVRIDAISETLAPFVARSEGVSFIVNGGKPGAAYPEISSLHISPDGRRVACRALKDAGWFVVIDDKLEFPGDESSVPVFSPDSKRVAYVMSRDGKQVLLIDGQPIAEHVHIQRDFAFSPDARRLAYVALGERDRTLFVHADGRSEQVKQFGSVESPHFSPGNGRLAYCARQGGASMLFVDDKPGAAFFSLHPRTLTWSPGGHHVACLGQRDGKSLLAIDAGASPAYDRIYLPARIPFDSDHSLVFLAVKEKNLIRVRVELPG